MMVEDNQLIAQYAVDGAEPPFAELVRRHINLVYATALRQVNGDSHLAEDITQNVFTDLARKSKDLTRSTSIAGWLYTSARFAASKAVRSETRRRAREEAAVAMIDDHSTPENASNDLRFLLEDALDQLDGPDREGVVLRFFEASDFSVVGAALGVTQNAARMRVERAIEKLRGILEKRGLTTTSSVLAATLSEWAAKAAPADLAATVIRTALMPATTGGVAMSPVAKVSALAKSKLVATAAALGILAASGLMLQRAMLGDPRGTQYARKPSSPAAGLNPANPIAALQTANSGSNAFQRLLERHDARVQAERARLAQSAEADWNKSKGELDQWTRAKTPGVTRFGASVRANLPFGHSIVTGGWNTGPGRRGIVLMSMWQIDAAGNVVPGGTGPGQFMVSYEFLNASSSKLDELGLQSLNIHGAESMGSLQLDPEQAQSLVTALKSATNTDMLGAPRITLSDQGAGSVRIGQNEVVEGREQELGVSASIQPIQTAPDGASMDLGITVRYAAKNPDAAPPSQPETTSSAPENASDSP